MAQIFNKIKEKKIIHIYILTTRTGEDFSIVHFYEKSKSEISFDTEQIEELKEELHSLGNTDEERVLICKTAFIRGWKGFYPLNKQKNNSNSKASSSKGKKKSNNNSFHNFEQRDYDYAALEEKLTESR